MKKSKLLMPALAIASTAAAVTPLMVSCNKTFSKTFQLIKDKKPVTFKPTTTQATGSVKDDGIQINKMYYEAVKANPEIFADDILYTFAQGAEQTAIWGCRNMTMSVINPTPKIEYYVDEMRQYVQPVLLWDFTLKGEWEWKPYEDKEYWYTASYEFNYHNLLLYWQFNDGSTGSKVTPSYVNWDQAYSMCFAFSPTITFTSGVQVDGKTYSNVYKVASTADYNNLFSSHKYEASVFIKQLHLDPWYLGKIKSK